MMAAEFEPGLQKWWIETQAYHIGQAETLLLVLPYWRSKPTRPTARVMRRMWCLWEIWSASVASVRITVALREKERTEFFKQCGYHETFTLSDSFFRWPCSRAEASPSIQLALEERVTHFGGPESFEDSITTGMQRWFLHVISDEIMGYRMGLVVPRDAKRETEKAVIPGGREVAGAAGRREEDGSATAEEEEDFLYPYCWCYSEQAYRRDNDQRKRRRLHLVQAAEHAGEETSGGGESEAEHDASDDSLIRINGKWVSNPYHEAWRRTGLLQSCVGLDVLAMKEEEDVSDQGDVVNEGVEEAPTRPTRKQKKAVWDNPLKREPKRTRPKAKKYDDDTTEYETASSSEPESEREPEPLVFVYESDQDQELPETADRQGETGPQRPHELTAATLLHHVAHTLHELEALPAAVEEWESVLPTYDRILGPTHPHTTTVQTTLALAYAQIGRQARSAELLTALLTSQTQQHKAAVAQRRDADGERSVRDWERRKKALLSEGRLTQCRGILAQLAGTDAQGAAEALVTVDKTIAAMRAARPKPAEIKVELRECMRRRHNRSTRERIHREAKAAAEAAATAVLTEGGTDEEALEAAGSAAADCGRGTEATGEVGARRAMAVAKAARELEALENATEEEKPGLEAAAAQREESTRAMQAGIRGTKVRRQQKKKKMASAEAARRAMAAAVEEAPPSEEEAASGEESEEEGSTEEEDTGPPEADEVKQARESCEEAALRIEEGYTAILAGEEDDRVRMERNGGKHGRAEEEACEDAAQGTMEVLASILCFDDRHAEAVSTLEALLLARNEKNNPTPCYKKAEAVGAADKKDILPVLEQLGETLRAQARYEEARVRMQEWVEEEAEIEADRIPNGMYPPQEDEAAEGDRKAAAARTSHQVESF